MADEGWIALGLMAGMIGIGNLDDARRGRVLRPRALGWAAVAFFFALEEAPWLWDAGGMLRLSSAGFVLCAVSPVLGYVWYGHEGAIQRAILRLAMATVLAAVGVVAGMILFDRQVDALLLAGLFALLPFFPSRSVGQWLRSRPQRRQRRRERREVRQQASLARRLAREERREKSRMATAAQKQVRQLTRQVTLSERRLSVLERGEHRERERLDSLRAEVLEQARSIRQLEAERVRQGEEGLVFDPHYGFLMAEGWRVLRSQIGQGGYGGLESDVALLIVVEEMLATPDDFELRYLHETGRTAMAAVNRHLRGEIAFSILRAELESLEWTPDILAPVPTRKGGEIVLALLEAWLVPHRRHQEVEWQLFCSGGHPRQDRLNEFFDEREIAIPSRDEWITLWDEHPAVFAG